VRDVNNAGSVVDTYYARLISFTFDLLAACGGVCKSVCLIDQLTGTVENIEQLSNYVLNSVKIIWKSHDFHMISTEFV